MNLGFYHPGPVPSERLNRLGCALGGIGRVPFEGRYSVLPEDLLCLKLMDIHVLVDS